MEVEIISPDTLVFSGNADLVSLPGTKGAFEIMKNHAAIISTLEKGKVKIVNNGSEQFFDINGGLVEFNNNKVSILAS